MKYIGAFLLLCVSTLCIKNTAGSYSYGHSLFTHGNIALKGLLPQPHSIHKRQIDIDDLESSRTCLSIGVEEQCSNGLIQAVVNLALRCNLAEVAEILSAGCQRNSMGDYCAIELIFSQDNSELADMCTESVDICATGCQDYLMSLREERGCCLNLFNDSSISSRLFSYALWSSCGVDTITEDCTSTVDLPEIEVDTSCTAETFITQGGDVTCTEAFVQPIIDRLPGECMVYTQALLASCGVDESGKHCYERSLELSAEFTDALSDCTDTDTSTCDTTCVATLDSVASSIGCCFNNLFNGSVTGVIGLSYDWLSNDYWSQCDLDSPGFCEVRLNGANAFQAHRIVPGLVAMLFLVLKMF